MRGTVRWVNPATGYAFIVAEDGRELFGECVLDCTGVNTLYEEDEIEFEVEEVETCRLKVTCVTRTEDLPNERGVVRRQASRRLPLILTRIDSRTLHRLLRRLVPRRDKLLKTIKLLTTALRLQVVTSAPACRRPNFHHPRSSATCARSQRSSRPHCQDCACRPSLAGR
jgi:cold shock CspA family protein